MSSLTVNLKDRRPIYEQLIDQIVYLVLHGVMQPNEQLPSVRTLAGELAINPNTIQKAYAELERQGVIYSLPGRGNFISPDIGAVAKQELERQMRLLASQLQQARNAGAVKAEICALLDAVFATTEERKDG